MRRTLIFFCLMTTGWLQYRLWMADGGVNSLHQVQADVAAQQEENHRLRQRNQRLAAEVAALKLGQDAMEERARSELGFIREGETWYQLVDGVATAAANPP